jgi:hypothetical protein
MGSEVPQSICCIAPISAYLLASCGFAIEQVGKGVLRAFGESPTSFDEQIQGLYKTLLTPQNVIDMVWSERKTDPVRFIMRGGDDQGVATSGKAQDYIQNRMDHHNSRTNIELDRLRTQREEVWERRDGFISIASNALASLKYIGTAAGFTIGIWGPKVLEMIGPK